MLDQRRRCRNIQIVATEVADTGTVAPIKEPSYIVQNNLSFTYHC